MERLAARDALRSREARRRTLYLDPDRLPGAAPHSLGLRTRRPGDRFQPLGFACAASLKRLLIARRVPAAERDALPLVAAGETLVAVLGLGPAAPYAVRPDSRCVLRIRIPAPPTDRPHR